MGSIINTTQTGYNEKTVVDNWAGEYINRGILQHKEKDVIDHPDGSVTFEKLDGVTRGRIGDIEHQIDKLKTSTNNADAKAVAAQNTGFSAVSKAESAQAVADIADKKADLAQVTADSAELKATLAQTMNSETAQKVDENHEEYLVKNEEMKGDIAALEMRMDDAILQIGDIDTALDGIIAIQNTLIGGGSE